MIFQRETWDHRFLHKDTALAVEKRHRWVGKCMVTMPVRGSERRVSRSVRKRGERDACPELLGRGSSLKFGPVLPKWLHNPI